MGSILISRLSKRRAGFTLIEILVSVSVIFVLFNIVQWAEIETVEVIKEDVNGASSMVTFRTKVKLECPSQGGWVTIVNPTSPGFVVLPSGLSVPLTILEPLAVHPNLQTQPSPSTNTSADAIPEAAFASVAVSESQVDPAVKFALSAPNSDNESNLTMQVAYDFEQVSQSCGTWLSFDVDRSQFVHINSEGEWVALSSHLHLNLRAIHSAELNVLELLPSEVFEFLQNHAEIVSSDEVTTVDYSASAPFYGVTIGNAAGGGVLVTNGGSPNASAGGGCGLMRVAMKTESDPSPHDWLLWSLSLFLGGLFIVRGQLNRGPSRLVVKMKSFSDR